MWNWVNKLEELRISGQPVVMITVTRCTGSTPREPGAKMLVLPNGTFFGTIGGGRFEALALTDAAKIFAEKTSKVIRYPLGAKTGQCCGGVAELFFELVNDGPSLYIFGAGHVGQAVSRTLVGTPFSVHLIDDRDEWINSPEISKEVIRHQEEWREVADESFRRTATGSKSYVVVMTHRHDVDLEITEYFLNHPVHYIGLIGSEAKWARFKQRLQFKNRSFFDATRLMNVRCPIGKKFGGKAPQEIAISIGGELLEEFYGRSKAKHASQESALRRSGGRKELAHDVPEGAS